VSADDKDNAEGKDTPFEVTDRRSASGRKDASRAAPAEEERLDETPETPLEIDPELAKQLLPQNVYDVLSGMLLMLTDLAWQKIGLTVSPVSGQIEKDFAQARVAIDTVSFIVDQLGRITPPEQQRDLRTLVANLQVNYARNIRESSPDPSEGS